MDSTVVWLGGVQLRLHKSSTLWSGDESAINGLTCTLALASVQQKPHVDAISLGRNATASLTRLQDDRACGRNIVCLLDALITDPLMTPKQMSVKLAIISEMEELAKVHHIALVQLSDDLPLLEMGLDSLNFAILLARLDEKLGIDPFSEADEGLFPATFGDLVRFYEQQVMRNATPHLPGRPSS